MVHILECPYQHSDFACGPRIGWVAYMLRDMGLKDSRVDKEGTGSSREVHC